MSLFEVIKYEGPNEILVWKHPAEDFSTKSQLIVHESQEAVFFKNGQALDTFSAGRHTLDTQNIPILSKLVNLPFGGESPFHCEVYFINKAYSMDIRWGTGNPVPIMDPVYNIILPIGANGQFGVQVVDSRKLLMKLVGTVPAFDQDTLLTYFRGILLSHIKDYIAKQLIKEKITFLEIHAHLLEISNAIAKDLSDEFEPYGIKLVHFHVNSIIVPENDPSYRQLKDAFAKKAEMGILNYNYQQERTFDVLEQAAGNDGGGGIVGAGIGLGMGVNLAGVFGQAMGGAVQNIGTATTAPTSSVTTCPSCGITLPSGARFCSGCGAKLEPAPTKCPKCGSLTPKGRFCTECGEKLDAHCPSCGAQSTGAPFCAQCGHKF